MNYFNDIITDDQHFIDVPDCIADGSSYQDTFEKAFNLTNGFLSLQDLTWFENKGRYDFELKVKDKIHKFSLDIVSDYVDSNNTIAGLNQILLDSGYTGDERFCDLNGGVADFGIAFITPLKEARLAEEGLIYRVQGKNEVGSETKKEGDPIIFKSEEDREQLLETLSKWNSESDDPIYKQLIDLIKSESK